MVEAFMAQSKTWGSHTSRRECLVLWHLFILRLWSSFYLKEIRILCVMLECLLSLTRRKAKSRTSTGTPLSALALSFLCYSLLLVLNVFMFLVFWRKQQQVERGDFSPCGTPTGLEARDQFDLQLGSLMLLLKFSFCYPFK